MVRTSRLAVIRYSILFIALLFLCTPLSAGNPHSAYYCNDTDKVLWFIHASDTHIGTSGSTDSNNLQWLVTTAKTVIRPSFIVVSGDLTDSTNGNWLGYPNGPYQAEWDLYKSILVNNVDASFYFDLPGNHDAYNDKYFSYYLTNSIQGRATGRTQASWTRPPDTQGTYYHFLGVNTCDNTGAQFSLISPYGDHAGLDSTELSFIESELVKYDGATLTMAFGHHPLVPTGDSSDTYLYYGKDQFVSLMNSHGASLYGYGHTHASSEKFFSQNMTDGVFYFNISALGKDSPNQYTVTAIDCNGISSVTQNVGTWPVVLITAPMNRSLGGTANPYAYTVTNATSNPIRALVFDQAAVSQVQFTIDGGTTWVSMAPVAENSPIWQGEWNASSLPEGEHTINVRAVTTSGTRTDSVTTYVKSQSTQTPPVAPSGLTASATSNIQINLTWGDNSDNEIGFKIERCAGTGCSIFAQIATVGGNVVSYSDTAGLSAGSSYSYRVLAYNSTGDSVYSNIASATTQASPTVPAAPSNLTAKVVSKSQINLTWTDNSTNETGFKIERCTGTSCSNFAQIATVVANVTTYSNTGLARNTAYKYRVRAYNEGGNSAYSNIVSVKTPK